jgi:carbon monoxide dehydrogenase subunit G
MKSKHIILAAAVSSLASTSAYAVEVTQATPVTAPAEKVWETIGGFCGIEKWHPAVSSCALSTSDGKPIRTIALKGGGTVVEQQLGRDEAQMKYTFAILEGPLPVANYVSTIQVEPSGSASSKVTWTASFEPKGASAAEAKSAVNGIFVKGLAGIVDGATKPR